MSEQIQDNRDIFVGRLNELSQIRQLLYTTVKTKTFQLLMVEGEPGTGKTTLIHEALEQARAEDPRLIITRIPCAQENQGTPLHPFQSTIYKRSFWNGMDHDYHGIAEAMLELSGLWIDELLLDGMPFASSLVIMLKPLIERKLKKEVEQAEIFASYKKFLEKRLRNGQALMLFMDDIHWIDPSSAKLLGYLKKELKNLPVLLIAGCRPNELIKKKQVYKLINYLFEGSRANRIKLTEGIDVFEYIDRRFPQNNIPKAFLKKIQDVFQGHPLAVVETVNLLKTDNVLYPLKIGDKQTWHIRNENYDFPPELDQLIYERLDRIPKKGLKLLEVAAVEGEYFTFEVITRALKKPPEFVIQLLQDLHRDSMLIDIVKSDGDFHSYRFIHKVYQSYLYKMLDDHIRSFYHESVGLALEDIYLKDKTRICMQLENHFSECNRMDKAIRYGMMSAKLAHKSCSWREAIQYAQQALNRCENQADMNDFNQLRCDAGVIWADSSYRLKKISSALQPLNDLVKQFDTNQTREFQVRILNELANLYYITDRETALKLAYEAVAAAEKSGNSDLIYTAKGYLSDILVDNENKYVEGRKILEELLELSEKLGDPVKIAETKTSLAWCLSDLGEYELTNKYAQEAVEIVKQSGFNSWSTKAFTYRVAGLGANVMGDFQLAREYTQQALDIYRENKDVAKEPWLLYEIGQFYQLSHDFDKAIPYFQEGLEKANELDDDESKIWIYTSWADLEIDRGNMALGGEHLAQVKALLERMNMNNTAQDDQEYKTCLAKLYYYQQRYDEARQLIEAVREQLDDNSECSTQAYEVKYWMGKILQAQKLYEEARLQLVSSVEMAEKFNDPIWKSQAYEGLGDLYTEIEELLKARYFYKKAIQVLQARFTHSFIDARLEAKLARNAEQLKGKWMQPDNLIIPLSRIYPCKQGSINVAYVNQKLFTHHYFTKCMACDFCHDTCCEYGVDIDIENVEQLKMHAEELKPYVRYPVEQWFHSEFMRDEEFPGNYFTRTGVKDGTCVFRNQLGRGCGIHRMCLDQGRDYHELKPMVCSLFPITFDYESLLISTELEDSSLICANTGPSAYRGNREELLFYFGPELVAELDEVEKQVLARGNQDSQNRL